MEWTYEGCTQWAIGIFIVLFLTKNYNEYKKLAAAKTTSFRFLIKPILLLMLGPFLCLSIPFCVIYNQAVKLILSWKYGNKFVGFLKGPDIVFALDKEAVYHLVGIVEYHNSDSEPFYEFVKRIMHEQQLLVKLKEDPKSFGTVRRNFGYFYLLKEEITMEDCLKKLKTVHSPTGEISISDLTRLLSDYSDSPLPKDNKALWEILIGTQPIKMVKQVHNESKKAYPMVLKGHHSLADAMHIFKTIVGLFADGNENDNKRNLEEMSINNIDKKRFFPKMLRYLKDAGSQFNWYIKQLYFISLSPAVVFLNAILMSTDPNLLHGSPLTNQKIMCINAEESPNYIQVVKRIKRKFPGCSFEDIFMAAFTTSFSKYFNEHSAHIPEYLVAEMPTVPEAVEMFSLNIQKVKQQKISCRNSMSAYVRKLPICIACGGSKRNLTDTLEFIKRERILLKKCVEQYVYYWLLNAIVTIVPLPLFELTMKDVQNTAVGISNVPGPPFLTVFGGCSLIDLLPFTVHRRYTGIAVCIFTYNNRLKLSLTVDKALISKEEEVQTILDRVYKYIDMLDSEA